MICLHCRKEITASALHTRHGEWCAECERWLRARQQAGARKNKNTEGIIGNRCAWCGDISDAADTCVKCARHRDWLLRCVRRSKHPFTVITTMERREGQFLEWRKRNA